MNSDQEWDDGFSGLTRKIKLALTAEVASMPAIVGGEYYTDVTFSSGKSYFTLYAADGSVTYKEEPSLTANGTLYKCTLAAVVRKETSAKSDEFDAYLRKPLILSFTDRLGRTKIVGSLLEPVYLPSYDIVQGAPTDNFYTIAITAILSKRPLFIKP